MTVGNMDSKMVTNIHPQQIESINSALADCDESSDVNHIEQIVLSCRYVSSNGLQEEIVEC